MSGERRPSETVQRVGRDALRLLQAQDFVSLTRVTTASRTSAETAKRAVQWLRDQGAPLEYVGRERAWCLTRKDFALPLAEPTVEDLQSALTAAGLLTELGQDVAAKRARALFDELAQRMSGTRARLRPDALRVTQTTAVVREPRWMLQLLQAARRGVVRLTYTSPWKRERVVHEFEPWQVCLHDGLLYVRGFSRTRRGARTFRLASVESLTVIDGVRPRAPVPAEPWKGDDPRYGIDEDRPDDAVVILRGPIARWVFGARWHMSQSDVWLEPDEVLERRLPYRSCREFARTLAAVCDGLEWVDPPELREEVLRITRAAGRLRRRPAGRKMSRSAAK